jgi:hypothetical protein
MYLQMDEFSFKLDKVRDFGFCPGEPVKVMPCQMQTLFAKGPTNVRSLTRGGFPTSPKRFPTSEKSLEFSPQFDDDLVSIPMPGFLKTSETKMTTQIAKEIQPAPEVTPEASEDKQPTPEMQSAGTTYGTTVMIRNIACRYVEEDIVAILDAAGLKGKYTDVHLPINPARRANLGYVFVKFASCDFVTECQEAFDGQVFGPSNTLKRCQVTLAHVQDCPRAKKALTGRNRSNKQQQEVKAQS